MSHRLRWRAALRTALQVLGAGGLVIGVAASAIVTKDARSRSALPPLVELDQRPVPGGARVPASPPHSTPAALAEPEPSLVLDDPLVPNAEPDEEVTVSVESDQPYFPPETKWFNGRPVRPARTITMVVTAYTPDEISCGDSADGITSSNHSVWTNGMRLVAADSRVLPLGSIVSVPGYAENAIVPVLDRGGKIKGNRLDVLYADNPTARKWGKKTLKVTVWEYADGKPADDWRAIRDSRRR